MNHRGRWRIGVLASAIALLGSLASLEAHALSLGKITVQSALGEPLRAEIDITEINPEEASSLNVGLASAETFKAAGLEYPSAATSLQIKLQRRANGKPYLRLNSSRTINEPFVDLILEASWSSGRLTKDYSMLFDPPAVRAGATALAMTAPVLAPAPATEPAVAVEAASSTTEAPQAVAAAPAADAARPLPEEAAVASTGERDPAPVAEMAPPLPEASARANDESAEPALRVAPAEKPSAARAVPLEDTPERASQVTVKPGDTANKIATRNKPSSVSLDQMLVALLRSNPNAFIGGNVNMVKSGAVLEIPDEDTASATSPSEARQMIVAQSKDFNAFRRKLAESVAAASVASADNKAGGKLQASVEDNAETSVASDTLKLSKMLPPGKTAATPEDRIIKEKEAQDSATRVAEINKNIDELKKLGVASPGTGPASASSGVPAIALPSSAASTPAEAPAASAADAASSAPLASASAAADSAAEAASAPASDASASAPLASASEPASAASEAAEPASAPASRPALVAAPEPEPELMDQLLDNAVPVLGGVGVLGLLGGLAIFMRRRKNKKSANPLVDSTFLESRLQPDSFFGASGGNRVNTNDNAPGSSMAYTPSQMDASGDVDPVAEADVYLAYGRDEQAEDILKEALHAYPERVAIHAKLLEIYKTRRDIKTFESVAAEAFRLTQGQGPEWAYIVELGSELDPANPLYRSVQPEPEPEPEPEPQYQHQGDLSAAAASFAPTPSAAASPASVDVDMDFSLDEAPQIPAAPVAVAAPRPSAAPPQVSPASASAPASTLGDLDLGLDFDLAPSPSPAPTPPATAPAVQTAPPSVDLLSNELEFDPVPAPSKPAPAPASAAPAAHDAGMMEFDLDAFSLDLGAPAAAAPAAAQEEDPLEVKFLLAEEFNSLGDTDGARALADEVLAKAKGPLKTKVQAFLNALS